MKSFKVYYQFIALSWAGFMSINSFATSFYPQPFPDTVHDAPIIVRGKAGMNYSDWSKDEEGSKRIYTFYELQVSEVLKGSLNGNSLIMREMGGEKDGVGLHVEGTSQYQRGEDVVVLLRQKNSDGSYDVQGMMMGKYNVVTDSEGRENLEGPGLHQTDTKSQNDPELPKKWSLDALRHLIQNQGQGQGPTSTADKIKKNQIITPSPFQSESPFTHSTPTALQLQPAESEDSPHTQKTLPIIGMVSAAALGTLLLYLFLRRRK